MATRRRWREWRLAALMALAPRLLSGALWLVASTVRVEFRGMEPMFESWRRGERVIVAFWHNRMLLMPLAYRGQQMVVLASRSRDGEIASRAFDRWGVRSVRGSASRGGVGGFRQMLKAYRDGCDLAVVPDGPRGPACHAKAGVMHLAKVTGARVFPVTYAAQRKAQLRSWDRFIIPLPFSRVVFVGGESLRVSRDAGSDEIEQQRQVLEARLNQISAAADAAVATTLMNT